MATRTLSWAIYARQSLDRTGAGLAVERQIKDCRALGRKLKLPGEPVVYADNDVSASSGKRRPQYERLLDALRGGRHGTLVAWHPDRLHRRNAELEKFIDIIKASGTKIHTVNAGEFDLSNSSGQMQARIVGAVAQREVEQKAERRARAIQQNAEKGKRHGGGRSFGYGYTVIGAAGRSHAHDIEKVNKREAAALRSAFDAILRGESTTSVWRGWNKRGITTQHGGRWNGSNFRAVITRASLAGLVVYKGETLEGVESAWPAIVPLDKWRAVQAIISDPARRTSPGNTVRHLASGVTFCECGLPLRAGTNSIKSKRTGIGRAYTVYRCSADTAGHSTILKHVLDAALREAIIAALYDAKDRPAAARSEDDDAALIELHTELETVREREARLAEAIAEGIISLSSARSASDNIKADVQRLADAIGRITRRAATAGVEDATWEALWEGVDVNGDTITRGPDGTRYYHAGRAVLQSMMRRGMSEAEAKAKIEIGRRFDDLTLDQQRNLVKSLVAVTVMRGRGPSRVTVETLQSGRPS